ncbi:MAG: macro domain-containing protein [Rhodobacteraceae bacterium]|nr:macro domain-containing protein [Paracoccaceae bacterium]
MIKYKVGDILTEDAEALVNTVNCVGFMGRGIARHFKRAFPENFEAYAAHCKRKAMQPGHVFVFETGAISPRYIINFPTKRHWRSKSKIEDIKSGLISLVKEIRLRKIRSIAIPALGCGLGGLDWPEVRRLMQEALGELDDVAVTIFEPGGGPADNQVNCSSDTPKMTPGRAALVGLMDCYLRGLLDPSVTLLETHKLMYFMQAAGEPLKLKFVKERHGPYAQNLRHVLKAIEGHLVFGYVGSGDVPGKQLEIVPGAAKDAAVFLKNHPSTFEHFKKVADLVDGFESPSGLELLSTVHWVACEERPRTMDAIAEHVYAWNERKKRFSRRQMERAARVLSDKGWMAVPSGMDA